MKENCMVSVFCLAYNHEAYIRKCLDGFVMQKTDFAFEVLIHDDASTDHTANIIREYEEKYPHIIKPIYQTENQHSKGIPITKTFLVPNAKGKYFATCEGDDYWTDPDKLQKQYDYMEAHADCAICVHRSVFYFVKSGKERIVPDITDGREYTTDEIIRSGGLLFATNSMFRRRETCVNMPECFSVKGVGDYQAFIFASTCGKCYCMPDVMSVYNYGTAGSWTSRVSHNKEKRLAYNEELIRLLKRIDAYYNGAYREAIEHHMHRTECNSFLLKGDIASAKKEPYRQFWEANKKSYYRSRLKMLFPWLRSIQNMLRRHRKSRK